MGEENKNFYDVIEMADALQPKVHNNKSNIFQNRHQFFKFAIPLQEGCLIFSAALCHLTQSTYMTNLTIVCPVKMEYG